MSADPNWNAFARLALDEDRAAHDATTNLLGLDGRRPAKGKFVAEETFVVAGLPLVQAVFQSLGNVTFVDCVPDGEWVSEGDVVAAVNGPFNVLLSSERVALNYLQRLCGIATQTRGVVDTVRDYNVTFTIYTALVHIWTTTKRTTFVSSLQV